MFYWFTSTFICLVKILVYNKRSHLERHCLAKRRVALVFSSSLLLLAKEAGGGWFHGHNFACLLCGVSAGLPLVEGLLHNDILIAQCIKEHPQQVCKDGVGRSVLVQKNAKPEVIFFFFFLRKITNFRRNILLNISRRESDIARLESGLLNMWKQWMKWIWMKSANASLVKTDRSDIS